jgi:hypothetical protein
MRPTFPTDSLTCAMLSLSAPRRNRTYNLVIKSQYRYVSSRRTETYVYALSRFRPEPEQTLKRLHASESVPKPPRKSPRMAMGHGYTCNIGVSPLRSHR